MSDDKKYQKKFLKIDNIIEQTWRKASQTPEQEMTRCQFKQYEQFNFAHHYLMSEI